MKIRAKLEKMLFESGLWEEEAKAIVDAFEKEDPSRNEAVKEALNKDFEGYGPQGQILLNIAYVSVKATAFEWLTKNKPQHWARGIFAPDFAKFQAEEEAKRAAEPPQE
jgi:hypothetical protein